MGVCWQNNNKTHGALKRDGSSSIYGRKIVGMDLHDGSGPFPTIRIIRNIYKDMDHNVMIDHGPNSYGD